MNFKILISIGMICCVMGDYPRKSFRQKGKTPKDIADVKKYFQDIYVAQLVPDEKEFGHVFEDPSRWEQRFEKIHLDNSRHQGKVKWGDDKGGYGEYYFDFNHGGDEDDNNSEEEGEFENGKYNEKQKVNDIDVLQDRRLPGEVELIPGFKLDKKAPLHGGNYRKLQNVN